jgi:hypothetical protein
VIHFRPSGLSVVELHDTRRSAWSVLPRRVRVAAWRRLADVEGLDGWAAGAAVSHALTVEGSPWWPAVQAAMGWAWEREVVRPIAAAVRSLVEVVRPVAAAYVRAMSGVVEQLRAAGVTPERLAAAAGDVDQDDEAVCHCFCGASHRHRPGVCLGVAPAGELVGVRFKADTPRPRTVAVCRPCAAAISVRALVAD